MRTPVACTVLLCVPCLALPAAAERLAVVPLAASGEIPADERSAIDEAVAAQLLAPGDEVLSPSEARAAIDARSPGCLTEHHVSCMARALLERGWETFVSGRVSRERPGADTRITLEAYRSHSGELLVTKTRATTATGPAATVALARTVANDISGMLLSAQRQARLSVDSVPTGASVMLAGRLLGRTPWNGEVAPGHVALRLELAGHRPGTRELILAPGGRHELSVALEALSTTGPAIPGASTRVAWQLPVGLIGLVAGAGLAALGVYGLTLEECTARFADGPCSERTTGTTWGAASLGAGVLLAAAGVMTAFVLELGSRPGGSNESE